MGRDNSGALFTPEIESTEDDAPYASGSLTLLGVEHYLDAWKIKENGEDQIDLRFKAKGNRSSKLTEGYGWMKRNPDKKKDNHPDWKGNLEVGDKRYPVAGWRQKSKNGIWYLSLAVEVKERQESRPQQEQEKEDKTGDYPF